MTGKRKDVPVFAAGYIDAIGKSSRGEAKHELPDPFARGGVAFQVIESSRVALRSRREECARAAVGTELWYYRAISCLADEFDAAVKQGRSSDSIAKAFALGMVIREWIIQHRHGGAIDLHSEQAGRLKNANTAKAQVAERNVLAWQAAAEKHWAKNRNLSRNGVAQLIAKSTGDNPDTIRKSIVKAPK